MSYDTRAFGDFGCQFMDAGEKYRKLKNVSAADKLMMCGLFKQATLGDCNCEEPNEEKTKEIEQLQYKEWLKYKGMDTIDAMKLYMDKVKELLEIYPAPEGEETKKGEGA